MSDNSENKKIYDKFDNVVLKVIVYSKASSIDAKVDCIYPESFVIGILVAGENIVTSTLIDRGIDLEKCLKLLKKDLAKKREFNEISVPAVSDLKISKDVAEACRIANKIRIDEFKDDEKINVAHIFLALIKTNDNIRGIFSNEGVTYSQFLETSQKVRELVESDDGAKNTKTKNALANFCTDITLMAKKGKLDPIIAREKEIENAITILCRRTKNNPILIGEAGVGKTAVVEGISQRIIGGTVPRQLQKCKVYSLSLSSLVAGTKYRGEFEERIQALIKEIQNASDCILFIDEIHTLVGAGSAAGNALDASNILKPFLARNDLRCIGATTLDDYKKYFAKDGALARRFQQIDIEEPTREQMKQILAGVRPKLEEYHKCTISDGAIESAIDLCDRYLKQRKFPDKAIDCLDTGCAKYAWGNGDKILSAKDVAVVVSDMCNVPLEVIMWDDYERIRKIEEILSSRVVGQKKAIEVVCRILKNAYSGIRNPDKPIGSFVFGGQSGTGKTYLAKELSKAIFGNDVSFIRLDMTEFSEQHSVSKLVGSPPGYVGFQETDVLIDKIKRKPYCIVLLDELEKAHPDVIKLFLQVMSDGIMTDASGNKADFKNVILIMTGNFGMNAEVKQSMGFSDIIDTKDPFEQAQKRLIASCKEIYGAEFINRVDEFVPFMPLSDEDLKIIAKMRLEEVSSRVIDRKCKITFGDDVCDLLIKMSKEEHGGNANILNRIISKKIENCISNVLMSCKNPKEIVVSVSGDIFIGEEK